MSLLKKGWNLNCILHNTKNSETVETVIITASFLLTPDLSRGLLLNNITSSTVSTVSFSNRSPFLSGLINNKKEHWEFVNTYWESKFY